MTAPALYDAVHHLAVQTHAFSDNDLGQPYRWQAHEEGVRFALIGSYHELKALAVELAQQRAEEGPALTRAQRALAPYHEAYRELQAVLLGVEEETAQRSPGGNAWPLRTVLFHIVDTERAFFTLVHYGLERQQADEELPLALPEEARQRIFGEEEAFYQLYRNGTLAELQEQYEVLHQRALETFAQIDDEALQGPSQWWEGEAYSLQYRLHRFDAHLRQHTVQAEQVLAQLGQRPNEVRRLLRLLYRALAEVESLLLGADGLAEADRQTLAETIRARAGEVSAVVAGARELATAVAGGEQERVAALLAKQPVLANAVNGQGVSLVLDALYRGYPEIAETFVEAGAQLSIMEGAALGRQDALEAAVAEWPGWVNEYNVDGFTPLQLACFFGRGEMARQLLEHGAQVNAVARNAQQVQALHAAVAGQGDISLVATLLEAGADPNGRQQRGFTALHGAAQAGDLALVRLLLEGGAEAAPEDEQGRTPADLARAQGHEAVVALLEQPEANST